MNRRSFLRAAAAAGLTAGALPRLLARQSAAAPAVLAAPLISEYNNIIPPARKLRVAFVGAGDGTTDATKPRETGPVDPRRGVGAGGRGLANIHGCHDAGAEIAALCDVNDVQAAKAFGLFPAAARYRDYRKMFDEMHGKIDAVVITVPDHMHYPVAMLALEHGKHIYVEKPLVHTVAEARSLRQAAARAGLVTQMGNQGHAGNGTRLVKEWVDAGLIGHAREVACWSTPTRTPTKPRAPRPYPPAEPIPEYIDWNLWQGVAPEEAPYSKRLTNIGWSSFMLFGTGGVGSMGSHLMDAPCWALGLLGDCRVSAKSAAGAGAAVSNPSHFTVTYEFPARGGRLPCILKWYNNDMPVLPPELGFEPGTSPSTYGFLIMGDKGAIYMNDPYCTVPRLLPEPLRIGIRENPVPRTIPRVPDGDQYAEWIRACQGIGPAPGSNIVDHSGRFLETILLGNIAIRTGRAINYDAAQGVIPDDPEAGALLTKTYRKF